jgi:hypothetical protein
VVTAEPNCASVEEEACGAKPCFPPRRLPIASNLLPHHPIPRTHTQLRWSPLADLGITRAAALRDAGGGRGKRTTTPLPLPLLVQ